MDGSWKIRRRLGRLQVGHAGDGALPNMPDDVAAAAQAAEDGITSGQITIFKGPIKDQDGNLKVAGRPDPERQADP